MPAGRPRKISFSPEEMIKLGEEMVKWVEEHPEVLHLSEWYTIEKMFTYNEWKTFIVKDEFFPYYEKALKMVGRKYLDKNSNIKDGISQRWQRVYFKDLKEEEDETAQFNSNLRKKENDTSNIPPDYIENFNRHMNALLNAQSSARNIEDTNSINETKS